MYNKTQSKSDFAIIDGFIMCVVYPYTGSDVVVRGSWAATLFWNQNELLMYGQSIVKCKYLQVDLVESSLVDE